MKGFGAELLRLGFALVLGAMAVRWTIEIIRPVLPLVVVVGLGGMAVRYLLRRRGL